MQVIGVLDLLGGLAVHARAGRRESYAPVATIAGSRIEPGDALAVARAYVDRLGLTELYVAHLDAILGLDEAGRTLESTVVGEVAVYGAARCLDGGESPDV